MNRLRFAIAGALAGLLLAVPSANADLDPIEQAVEEAYERPLRWYGAARAPWLIGADRGLLGRLFASPRLTLHPGEPAVFWLGPQEILRVRRRDGTAWSPELPINAFQSSGGGLFKQIDIRHSGNRKELLVGDTDEHEARLIMVELKQSAAKPQVVAVFRGVYESLPEPLPFRDELTPEPVSWLTRDDSPAAARVHVLEPGRHEEWSVEGPRMLRIRLRPLFTGDEYAWRTVVRFRVLLNGELLRDVMRESEPRVAGAFRLDDALTSVGREEVVYLEIPPGSHRLALVSDDRAIVNVMGRAERDFLLPHLNGPPEALRSRLDAKHAPLPVTDPWRASPDELRALLPSWRSLDPGQIEAVARRLAWDHDIDDGGLLAHRLLQHAQARWPQSDAIRRAADWIRRWSLYWKPLEPRTLPAGARRRIALAFEPKLRTPSEEASPIVLFARQTALAHRLDEAVFHDFGEEGSRAMAFALPEASYAQRLRLRAPADYPGEAELTVSFDDGSPTRIRFEEAPALPGEALLPDVARAAVQASDRPLAPVVRTASVELPLPDGTREISIESSDATLPPVAVDLLVARPSQLALRSYLRLLREADGPQALLRASLQSVLTCPSPEQMWSCAPPAAVEAWRTKHADAAAIASLRLFNHWIPSLRLVRARYEQLSDDLVPLEDPPRRDDRDAETLIAKAQDLLNKGQPLAALATLADAYDGADPALRSRVRKVQIASLETMGESFLAERLHWTLALQDNDDGLSRWSLDRLWNKAKDEASNRRSGIAAVTLWRHGDIQALRQMVEALLLESPPAGVMFGLAMDDPPPGIGKALAEIGWLEPYLEASDRDRVEEIRGRLLAGDSSSRAEAITQWAEHWQNTRLPGRWVRAQDLLEQHSGAVWLTSVHRENQFQMFTAEPNRPAAIGVVGPASLRLEIRPIHPMAETAVPFDGWYQLSIDGDSTDVPITGNLPAHGLFFPTRTTLPGFAEYRTVELGPGYHRIQVGSDSGPLLLAVERWRAHGAGQVLHAPTPTVVVAAKEGLARGEDWIAERPLRLEPERWAQLNGGVDRLPKDDPLDLAVPRLATGAKSSHDELAQIIHKMEIDRSSMSELLPEAASIIHAHPDDPEIQRAANRIRRLGVRWEKVRNVLESAGLRRVAVPRSHVESPALRARLALIDELREDEIALYDGSDLVIDALGREEDVHVELRHATVLGLERRPIAVSVGTEDDLRIVLVEPATTKTLVVPAGSVYRMTPTERLPNHFVMARLLDPGGTPIDDAASQQIERVYQVATPDEPVVLGINGPAWLRVDELREGRIFSEFVYVEAGFQKVTLRPRGDETMAFLRIHRLVPEREPEKPEPLPLSIPAGAGLSDQLAELPEEPAQPDSVDLVDRLEPGSQDPGSLTTYIRVGRRPLTDIDSADDSDAEQRFAEAGIVYRHADPEDRMYWQGGALLREDDEAQPLIGLDARADRFLDGLDWRASGVISLRAQDVDNVSQDAWSLTGRVGIERYWELNEKTGVSAFADAFGRHLSLDRSDIGRSEPDPDIWTDYKQDHRWGVGAGLGWSHLPWQDMRLSGGIAIDTNERLTSLDKAQLSNGLDIKIGPVIVGAEHRLFHFFDDKDRSEAKWRNDLVAQVLWDIWLGGGRRLELSLDGSRRLETGDWRADLSVSLHWGGGREFRDYRPGETRFRRLRSLDAPAARWNNEVTHDAQ